MPESGEGPDRQHIAEGHKFPLPAASQGNIYVIPEPAPQGHVPPSPEFCHGKRQVWVMKIFRDRKAHDPPQPLGHQGIAVKIKIDLEAEGCDGQPCKGSGDTFIAHGPGLIPEPAQAVCQKDLESQSYGEGLQSLLHRPHGMGPAGDLLLNGGVGNDGTGDQLGKHTDIHGEIHKRRLIFCRFPVHVRQIGNGLEGIKADPHREHRRKHRKLQGKPHEPEDAVDIFCKKAGIFKQQQPEQIISHSPEQPLPPAEPGPAAGDPAAKKIVHCHGRPKERQIKRRIPDAVQVKQHAPCEKAEVLIPRRAEKIDQ